MAICTLCSREMRTAASCVVDALHHDGVHLPLERWGDDPSWPAQGQRCHDCGVQPGGLHHLGCDIQRCPRCRRQLLSCGCRFDEDGPDPDEEE